MKKLALGCSLIVGTAYFSTQLLSENKKGLVNYESNYQCAATDVLHPSSISEVQDIVKKARAQGRKVMTGSEKFASQLDAACADQDQVQITLKNLNKIVEIDKDKLTVTAEAGVRFNELNNALDKERLSINMVSELNVFTLGGMLGSGTHGTTIKNKSALIADYVTELKIVDGFGELRTLTGVDLDRARVNLGVLGVVVEMTIEVEPAFKIEAQQITVTDDSELEDKILSYPENNFSASVAWFPGLNKYTATLYNKVDYDTPGDAYNAQADAQAWKFWLYKNLNRLGHKSTITSCSTAYFRYRTRKASFFKSKETDKYLTDNVIGKSHEMQYFQCKKKDGEDVCAWDIFPIKLQEIGIAYEDTIDAIKDIRAILDEKRACFSLNGIYFRFSNASNSILSMNAGRKSTFFSIEYALNPSGKAPVNYDVFQEIEQLLLKKYNGRPHFGKNSIPVFLDVKEKFPRFNEFVAFKERLDPDNVFSNQFWERIVNDQLDEETQDAIFSDRCVDKDTCYCSEDRHCPSKKKCMPGRFFEDASICR